MLVGPTDSGKTWFIRNEVIPNLKKEGYKMQYIKDCDWDFSDLTNIDFVFVDEVETLTDRAFLEKRHPEEVPYYTDGYLETVKQWNEKLARIKTPAVFLIARNEDEEVDNLVKKMKVTDWGTKVMTLRFSR